MNEHTPQSPLLSSTVSSSSLQNRCSQPKCISESLSPSQLYRNKAIVIATGLFMCLVGAVIVYLYFFQSHSISFEPKFEFKDVFDPALSPLSFEPNWLPQGESYTLKGSNGDISYFNCTTKVWANLFNTSQSTHNGTLFSYSRYWIVPTHQNDNNLILFSTDEEKIYRHSFFANYFLYHRKNNQFFPISSAVDSKKLRLVQWNHKGDQFVFVRDNNIFYRKNLQDQEIQITWNGHETFYFNGVPSWTYEEEIFSSNSALWWSNSDRFLCYLSFNETNVQNIKMPMYNESSYDSFVHIAYPKPGSFLPKTQIHVYDTLSHQTVTLNLPSFSRREIDGVNEPQPEQDFYIYNVVWSESFALKNSSAEKILITKMNRHQNLSEIYYCEPFHNQEKCFFLLQRRSQKGWIDDNHSLRFLTAENSHIASENQTSFRFVDLELNEAGFSHIKLYSFSSNSSAVTSKFITLGEFEVENILTIHENQKLIYFSSTETSSGVGDPLQRHVWAVNYETLGRNCLTCPFGEGWYRISFSPSFQNFVLHWEGPDIPQSTLHSTKNPLQYIILENNSVLREHLTKFQATLPYRDFFKIPSSDGSLEFNAVALRPFDFSVGKSGHYRVLVEVYGGPGSQKVMKKFNSDFWSTYLVASRNFIHIMVDGRGTGFRGREFRQVVYRQLGKFESFDQIQVGKYLKNLEYIDPNQIFLWGWSYGGFVAASVCGHPENDVFSKVISVAPVTDWKYYDAVYTERYMSTPDDNLLGYQQSRIMKNAGNFKKSNFLLVHGTGDDNVHFQNSAVLIAALTEANVDFQMQIYTNQTHRLNGGNTFHHLYRLLTQFLTEEKIHDEF